MTEDAAPAWMLSDSCGRGPEPKPSRRFKPPARPLESHRRVSLAVRPKVEPPALLAELAARVKCDMAKGSLGVRPKVEPPALLAALVARVNWERGRLSPIGAVAVDPHVTVPTSAVTLNTGCGIWGAVPARLAQENGVRHTIFSFSLAGPARALQSAQSLNSSSCQSCGGGVCSSVSMSESWGEYASSCMGSTSCVVE